MRSLTTMPTRNLPPGYERISAPWQDTQRLRAYLARAEATGEITVVRPIYRTPAGTVYATIKRHRKARREVPRWLVPVAYIGCVSGAIVAAGYFAMRAVESVADAVTHPSKEAAGVLLLIGLGLLALAGRGRTVSGTFRGVIK